MLRKFTDTRNMRVTIVVILGISSSIDTVKGECNGLPVVNYSTNDATVSQAYASGVVVTFTCKPGFNTVGTSRSFTCDGSSWINGNVKCDPIKCNYIGPPVNGRVTNSPSYDVRTNVAFACDAGYVLVGPSALTCRVNGGWDRSPPTCKVKFCPDFGSIPNGSHFQDAGAGGMNSYDSVERVTCKQGYLLNGPPNVHCEANGMWGERPECKPFSCPVYPGLNSSCIDRIWDHGQTLYITCLDDSHDANISVTRTGSLSADCFNNDWDDTSMRCHCDCKINVDTTFVTVSNSNAKGFLKYGEKLQWKCNPGSTASETTNSFICLDNNMAMPHCTPSSGTPFITSTKDPRETGTEFITSTKDPRKPETGTDQDTTIIILSTIGGLLLVGAVIVVGCCYKKAKMRNNRRNRAMGMSDDGLLQKNTSQRIV